VLTYVSIVVVWFKLSYLPLLRWTGQEAEGFISH